MRPHLTSDLSVTPLCHANTWEAEHTALRNRVLLKTLPIDPDALQEWRRHCAKFKSVLSQKIGRVRPWTLRKTYERARDRHGAGQYYPAYLDLARGYNISRRDAVLKLFLKQEKHVPEPDGSLKTPRCIQFRGPKYNLALGKFLYPIEHAYYAFFHKPNPLRVFTSKGMGPGERSAFLAHLWENTPRPCSFYLDFSRMDAHIRAEHLREEHSTYLSLMKDRRLQHLLSFQIRNRGITKHGIKYKKKGGRASGDLNTALGNTDINLKILSYVIKDIPGASAICESDDAVIFFPKEKKPEMEQALTIYERLGFKIKLDLATTLDKVRYCSSFPLDTGLYGHIYCREWPKPLHNDCWSSNPVTGDNALDVRRRVTALSYKIMYSGCPVYEAQADWMLSWSPPLGTLKKGQWVEDRYKLCLALGEVRNIPGRIITPTARASFACAFGVLPTEQLEIEAQFRRTMGKQLTISEAEVDILRKCLPNSYLGT